MLRGGSGARAARGRFASVVVATLGAAACRAPAIEPPSIAAPTRAPSPCEAAGIERARVPSLLAQGKLDRVLRVVARADAACPSGARDSWAARVTTLAAIGRTNEASALAAVIDAAPDAPADAREASRRARGVIDAHDAPSGEALVEAGTAASRRGDAAEAQRCYDRALVAIERAHGPVRVTPRAPFGGSIALSRDGRWAAIATEGGVSLRDAARRFEETRFLEGAARAIAFSPDAATLAVAGEARVVTLWDVARDAAPRRISHPARGRPAEEQLEALAFSPDGKLLASASGDGGMGGGIELWDAATGDHVRAIAPPAEGASLLAFSVDGASLFASSYRRGVRTYRVATGLELHPHDHGPTIRSLAVSPRGNVVFAEGAIVDATTGREVRRLYDLARVKAAAFSPDGASLALALDDGVELWRGAPLERAATRAIGAASIAFTRGGDAIAIGGEDLVLVDPKTLADVEVVRGPRPAAQLESIALARGAFATAAATQSGDGVRVWWPARASTRSYALDAASAAVALSPDAAVVAGATPALVRLFDAATGARRIDLAARDVHALAFAPDGRTLASAGGGVRLWDIASGSSPVPLAEGVFTRIAFSPDGGALAALGIDADFRRRVSSWDLRGHASPHDVMADAFAFGKGLFAIAGSSITLRSADGRAREIAAHASTLALSPDGAELAWSGGRDLHVVELAQGDRRVDLDIHHAVTALAFTDHALISLGGDLDVWSKSGVHLAVARAVRGADAAYTLSLDDLPRVEILGPDDAAAKAALACRAGAWSFPFAVCRERFESTGLLAAALAGAAVE